MKRNIRRVPREEKMKGREWNDEGRMHSSHHISRRSSVSSRPGIFGPSFPFLLPLTRSYSSSLSSVLLLFFLSPSLGIPQRFFHSLSFKGCRIHFTSLSICHPPILLGWKGNRKRGRDVYHPQSALFVYIS